MPVLQATQAHPQRLLDGGGEGHSTEAAWQRKRGWCGRRCCCPLRLPGPLSPAPKPELRVFLGELGVELAQLLQQDLELLQGGQDGHSANRREDCGRLGGRWRLLAWGGAKGRRGGGSTAYLVTSEQGQAVAPLLPPPPPLSQRIPTSLHKAEERLGVVQREFRGLAHLGPSSGCSRSLYGG